jgi:hypothetical protein
MRCFSLLPRQSTGCAVERKARRGETDRRRLGSCVFLSGTRAMAPAVGMSIHAFSRHVISELATPAAFRQSHQSETPRVTACDGR